MFIKLAIRNLFRNKRRTIITAASVFFAVFFAILMRSLQLGVYDNMIKNVVGYYHGYAQIMSNDYWQEANIDNVFENDATIKQSILQQSFVTDLVPRIQTFALASIKNITKGVLITGIKPDKEKSVLNIEDKLVAGNYFSAQDKSVIIGEELANFMQLSINDTLVLLSSGYHGASAAGKYPIVGIAQFGSPELSATSVCMPLLETQNMFGTGNQISYYIVQSQNPKTLEKNLETLNAVLPQQLTAKGWKEILPELIQLIEADNAGGQVIIAILYLIIGFGMFGTILMMTTERLYEFGVLISIGMQRWRLIIIQVLEGIFVSFLGVIAGTIFSIPVILWFYYHPINLGNDLGDFTAKYDLEPVLHFSLAPEIFYMQAFWVLIMAIIINWYPILKINKLKVVEALRS